MPGSEVTFAEGAGPDLRNYRVDFSKLNDTFPGAAVALERERWRGGARAGLHRHGLTYADFTSSRFVRLRRINDLLSAGLLDDMLRRRTSAPFPAPDAEAAPAGTAAEGH